MALLFAIIAMLLISWLQLHRVSLSFARGVRFY